MAIRFHRRQATRFVPSSSNRAEQSGTKRPLIHWFTLDGTKTETTPEKADFSSSRIEKATGRTVKVTDTGNLVQKKVSDKIFACFEFVYRSFIHSLELSSFKINICLLISLRGKF